MENLVDLKSDKSIIVETRPKISGGSWLRNLGSRILNPALDPRFLGKQAHPKEFQNEDEPNSKYFDKKGAGLENRQGSVGNPLSFSVSTCLTRAAQ